MRGNFPEPQRTAIAELLLEEGHPPDNIGLFLCELDGVWAYHAHRKRAVDAGVKNLKGLLKKVRGVLDRVDQIEQEDPELVNCVLLGYGPSDTSIGEHLPALKAMSLAIESAIRRNQPPAHRPPTPVYTDRSLDIITRAYANLIAAPVATEGKLFERVLQLVLPRFGKGFSDSTAHKTAASTIKPIKNS